MWIKFYSCFFILLGMIGCRTSADFPDVPVIPIDPDAAVPFVASDFFDGYRIVTFKDVICTKIGDFVDVGNKMVASVVVRQGASDSTTIGVFDKTGHYLYPLGGVGRGPGEYLYIPTYLELTRDSTIFIKSILGWLEYDVTGKLLGERRLPERTSVIWTSIRWKINDTTLLFVASTDIEDNLLKAPLIQVATADDFRVKHSYFPLLPGKDLITNNQFYAFKDTVCVYVDMESCVHNVREDTVLPRYVIDKGKYDVMSPRPDKMNPKGRLHLPNSLVLKTLSENSRYVIGRYLLDETYYFFLYDKRLGKTYDLKSQLEDDLVFGRIPNLFYHWEPGMQINDEYMYFYFTPFQFSRLMKSVRKKMTEAEWEAYRQKHPDLMQVYDEWNEESNTVVVGYRFKK